MSITIPLGIAAPGAKTASTPTLSLATLSLGTGNSRQGVLRAVIAAVALKDPGGSLDKAKLARDSPGQVINPSLVDTAELRKILSAIENARENPSDAKPSDEVVAAARAAGADARLTAAAFNVVNTDTGALTNGMNWAAALDATLLEQAARAAANETLLAQIPDQLTRLSRVEVRLDDVDKRVKVLETSGGGGTVTQSGGGTGGGNGPTGTSGGSGYTSQPAPKGGGKAG